MANRRTMSRCRCVKVRMGGYNMAWITRRYYIKKVSSLIRLEGEVRMDGQANGGAYPIMQFNIIYIMRTHVVIRGFWRPGLIMGFLL